ncbi:MAG: hypothetical protein EP326_04700 [Deltaproteobacteria bacterium]|nr:MAG: hypothetical protein EP326_04700 [Deltaproteobacteria bacterium]TNF31038.1 MAG: hypothetical protein EP319_03510 [Deltaproteobacteria bacterium]
MKLKRSAAGQALIEYIIIFSFMAIIAMKMVDAINGYLTGTMGNLAFYLSQQLSVGVCKKKCFVDSFKNNK